MCIHAHTRAPHKQAHTNTHTHTHTHTRLAHTRTTIGLRGRRRQLILPLPPPTSLRAAARNPPFLTFRATSHRHGREPTPPPLPPSRIHPRRWLRRAARPAAGPSRRQAHCVAPVCGRSQPLPAGGQARSRARRAAAGGGGGAPGGDVVVYRGALVLGEESRTADGLWEPTLSIICLSRDLSLTHTHTHTHARAHSLATVAIPSLSSFSR